jgi:hypothetical protein
MTTAHEFSHHESLMKRIDGFLDKSGMAPSTFSMRAVKSAHFVTAIRNGRRPRQSTLVKIEGFIRDEEARMQRMLSQAIAAIKSGDGYVQVDSVTGEPINLPRGVAVDTFKQLIKSGQLQPGGDSFLGGRPQTYGPIG